MAIYPLSESTKIMVIGQEGFMLNLFVPLLPLYRSNPDHAWLAEIGVSRPVAPCYGTVTVEIDKDSIDYIIKQEGLQWI